VRARFAFKRLALAQMAERAHMPSHTREQVPEGVVRGGDLQRVVAVLVDNAGEKFLASSHSPVVGADERHALDAKVLSA
jgi:hypothetical protein